jgi:hypothetical protein
MVPTSTLPPTIPFTDHTTVEPPGTESSVAVNCIVELGNKVMLSGATASRGAIVKGAEL